MVMREWRDRAFLRAELREAGIEAYAADSLEGAMPWVLDPRCLVKLLIYDCRGQESLDRDIENLTLLSKSLPVLIIREGALKPREESLAPFKHVVVRPVTIGSIVDLARMIIGGEATEGH